MLPASHCQHYEAFKQTLEKLRRSTAETSPNPAYWKTAVLELQQFFQQQILSGNLDELTPTLAHQVRSYQVEIDKQLRLLTIDVMFLQAAHQETTASQRQSQMDDRLTMLIRYCKALLGEAE